MIIAVNISKALAEGKSLLEATERAWDLDIERCREHEYVIGVEKGQIKGCFKLENVVTDVGDKQRVAFVLEPCSAETEQMIISHIRDNDINLGGVQRGKYI
jgi:hypothetical protein